MIVAFTGHRPQHLDPRRRAECQYNIRRTISTLGPDDVVISGMALGVDTWAASAAVDAGVPFDAYIPFTGQHERWPDPDQDLYNDLVRKARRVRIICTGGYRSWKFQKRNEAMVDDCDVLDAHFIPGKTGGTMNCMHYAEQVGRTVVRHPL